MFKVGDIVVHTSNRIARVREEEKVNYWGDIWVHVIWSNGGLNQRMATTFRLASKAEILLYWPSPEPQTHTFYEDLNAAYDSEVKF